jgi:hypothetical protein
MPLNVVLVVVWKEGGQVNSFLYEAGWGRSVQFGSFNEVPLLVAPTRVYKS